MADLAGSLPVKALNVFSFQADIPQVVIVQLGQDVAGFALPVPMR